MVKGDPFGPMRPVLMKKLRAAILLTGPRPSTDQRRLLEKIIASAVTGFLKKSKKITPTSLANLERQVRRKYERNNPSKTVMACAAKSALRRQRESGKKTIEKSKARSSKVQANETSRAASTLPSNNRVKCAADAKVAQLREHLDTLDALEKKANAEKTKRRADGRKTSVQTSALGSPKHTDLASLDLSKIKGREWNFIHALREEDHEVKLEAEKHETEDRKKAVKNMLEVQIKKVDERKQAEKDKEVEYAKQVRQEVKEFFEEEKVKKQKLAEKQAIAAQTLRDQVAYREERRAQERLAKREREMRELADIREAQEQDRLKEQKKFEARKQRQVEARAEWIARRKEKAERKKVAMAEDVRLAKEWTAMVNAREKAREDAYAAIYEKQRARQQAYAKSSGAEEKAKADAEAAKIAKWQAVKDEADRKEAERRARKRREANEDMLKTLERQLEEKKKRKQFLDAEDKKYGAIYVKEAQKAIEIKKMEERELMRKNQVYQAELKKCAQAVQEEKVKKSVTMTQLEKSLNKDLLERIVSSPDLFVRLKAKVEKACAQE